MPRLHARFRLPVNAPCLIQWPEQQLPPTVEVTLGRFRVNVLLLPSFGQGVRPAPDQNFITDVEFLELTVSREEPGDPLAPFVSTDGTHNWEAQYGYLRGVLPAYRSTARQVANEVLSYFKYQLQTPLVKPIGEWSNELHSPVWFDANDARLPGSFGTILMQPMPGTAGEMGVRRFTPAHVAALGEHLQSPRKISITEDLLSNAQSAWFEDELIRAVIELAIGVEVAVKRRYFAHASPAGSAFDWLEDKARLPVRVLDLLDPIAKEAFSRSYKAEFPDDYEQIDFLIRCRNKAVHRGELSYRTDGGILVQVGKPLVERWWKSANHLVGWLASLP
jgi:hypothetical protein